MNEAMKVLADTEIGECWRWRGGHIPQGYGMCWSEGKTRRVHRVVWESLIGPLGELVVDHMCLTKDCVNPDHLRAVTQAENLNARWDRKPGRQARNPATGRFA